MRPSAPSRTPLARSSRSIPPSTSLCSDPAAAAPGRSDTAPAFWPHPAPVAGMRPAALECGPRNPIARPEHAKQHPGEPTAPSRPHPQAHNGTANPSTGIGDVMRLDTDDRSPPDAARTLRTHDEAAAGADSSATVRRATPAAALATEKRKRSDAESSEHQHERARRPATRLCACDCACGPHVAVPLKLCRAWWPYG